MRFSRGGGAGHGGGAVGDNAARAIRTRSAKWDLRRCENRWVGLSPSKKGDRHLEVSTALAVLPGNVPSGFDWSGGDFWEHAHPTHAWHWARAGPGRLLGFPLDFSHLASASATGPGCPNPTEGTATILLSVLRPRHGPLESPRTQDFERGIGVPRDSEAFSIEPTSRNQRLSKNRVPDSTFVEQDDATKLLDPCRTQDDCTYEPHAHTGDSEPVPVF